MRWYGAHYGKRDTFCEYARKTGLKMGQLKAAEIVFIADGAKHNWEIQINNFPDAIPILDFYPACEHLANFCSFLPKKKSEKQNKKCSLVFYSYVLFFLRVLRALRGPLSLMAHKNL